jgi:hypothetical protein
MSSFSSLPPEVVTSFILPGLGPFDLARIRRVSRSVQVDVDHFVNKINTVVNMKDSFDMIHNTEERAKEQMLSAFKFMTSKTHKIKRIVLPNCWWSDWDDLIQVLRMNAKIQEFVMVGNSTSPIPRHVVREIMSCPEIKTVKVSEIDDYYDDGDFYTRKYVDESEDYDIYDSDQQEEEDILNIRGQVLDLFLSLAQVAKVNLGILNLNDLNLTDRPDETLGTALVKVNNISLSGTSMTTHQWNIFFKEMTGVVPAMERIDLSGQDLTEVETDYLGAALARVENLDLESAELTTGQWNTLFREMKSADKVMKSIGLSGQDLTQVNTEILGEALARVEYLDLDHAELTTDQWNILSNFQKALGFSRHMSNQ